MIARRFELVIFDCDGVLVDSEPIINRAHAEVLSACGYPITENVLVEVTCSSLATMPFGRRTVAVASWPETALRMASSVAWTSFPAL